MFLLPLGWRKTWKDEAHVYHRLFYQLGDFDDPKREDLRELHQVVTEMVRVVCDALEDSRLVLAMQSYFVLRRINDLKHAHRLTEEFDVDLPRLQVTYKGRAYDLRSERVARWLRVLSANPGHWISGTRLVDYDPELDGARTDRLRKQLPKELAGLIETNKRKGARLNLA